MRTFYEDKSNVLEYQRNLNDNFNRRNSTAQRELRRIEDIIHIKHNFPYATSILCIGARDDSEVMTFINKGFEARGIDVCTETSLITRKDVSDLDPDIDGKYDIVYCSHVLEHLSDPVESMLAIRRVAKQGVFIILPIVDRAPDIEHPTVYEIMKYTPVTNYKNQPSAWDDFAPFQPYLVPYNCYRNAITEPYEIAFILKLLKDMS